MYDILAQIGLPAFSILVVIVGGYLLRESIKTFFTNELESVKNGYNVALEELRQRHRLDIANIERKHEEELSVRKKVLIDRYEALKALDGYLHEFDHALNHISEGRLHKMNIFEKFYQLLRDSAREHAYILGDDMLTAVIKVTDTGKQYISDECDGIKYNQAKTEFHNAQEEVAKQMPTLLNIKPPIQTKLPNE